jgi:hypothetical protein
MTKHSTPQSRNAARDYWNSPSVVAKCKALDYSFALFIGALALVLGSINL